MQWVGNHIVVLRNGIFKFIPQTRGHIENSVCKSARAAVELKRDLIYWHMIVKRMGAFWSRDLILHISISIVLLHSCVPMRGKTLCDNIYHHNPTCVNYYCDKHCNPSNLCTYALVSECQLFASRSIVICDACSEFVGSAVLFYCTMHHIQHHEYRRE